MWAGPIPSEIGLLAALEEFFADGNQLSGMWATPLGLRVVNEITNRENTLFLRAGCIPTEIGLLTAMTDFHANDNQLSGM